MGFTYEKMKKFMQDYYADFNRYANDMETIHKMNEYWTPDFKVVAYFSRRGGNYPITYSTREEFQDFLHKTHQVIKDSLNPLDFVIDENTKKVVILIKIIKTNIQTTDEIEIFGMGSYQLVVDGGGDNFKIDRLDFICDAPDATKMLGEDEPFIYAF